MSIIVWDGGTIAADKQGTACDLAATHTKLKQLSDGTVLGWTGEQEQGLCLARWFEAGSPKDKWPKFQEGEDWTRLIVARFEGVFTYERVPEPVYVEDPFMAWGSGRDFAMGAMELGAGAEQAVIVASKFNVYCGRGVSSFKLSPEEKQDGN